jgi:ATP diphosphatase
VFEAVFLARMHEEAGHFSIGDVVDGIADKLVRRHPHVFERGDDEEGAHERPGPRAMGSAEGA